MSVLFCYTIKDNKILSVKICRGKMEISIVYVLHFFKKDFGGVCYGDTKVTRAIFSVLQISKGT